MRKERFSGIVGGMYNSIEGLPPMPEPKSVHPSFNEVTVHVNKDIDWQRRYRDALLQGIPSGYKKTVAGTSFTWKPAHGESIVHVVLGPNLKIDAPPHLLITVNRCFFGAVDDHVSIGWGGFNGYAVFPEPDPGWKRAENHDIVTHDIRTWKEGVLVLGEYAREAPEIGTCLRPHPLGTPNPHKIPTRDKDFDAVAVYGGTTAVVGYVLQGYPVLVHSQESVARWLPTPVYTEQQRDNWIERLCWAQWRIDEIRDGVFWDHLMRARNDCDAMA